MKLTTVSAALMCGLTIATLILLRPLMPIDETRYLAVSWEMYQGGSTLVPHLNGALYAHKPPLLFWLIDLVWLIGGVSTFGARLVAPTFAVAAVMLTGQVARRLWPDQPSARSGCRAGSSRRLRTGATAAGPSGRNPLARLNWREIEAGRRSNIG